MYSVLIVENEDKWRKMFADGLGAKDYKITQVSTAQDAIERIEHQEFDVIVLNLHLMTKRDYLGEKVLEFLTQKSPGTPCIIVSGNPDRFIKATGRYQEQVYELLSKTEGVEGFDLATLYETIDRAILDSQKRKRKGMSPVDFLVVTALEEERDAVLRKLPGYQRVNPSSDDVRVYFATWLDVTMPDTSKGEYSMVVMPLLRMGRVQASTATNDAIRKWHPRYVIFVGIAGGIAFEGVNLGDVIVSDQIVDYEQQKITSDGPKFRYQVHRADERLLAAAHDFLGDDWQKLIEMARPSRTFPKRHLGPIATGDKVVADADFLEEVHKDWPKLIGVEMEAGGAASACFQAAEPKPGFFMIRGVSDLADQHKDSDEVNQWRLHACDVAASYTIALLKSGPVPFIA